MTNKATARKNFTSIPNSHFVPENENESILDQLDYRQDYVFCKMQACKDKWGQQFQKSVKQLAVICKMSDSTFKRIIKSLEELGLISHYALQKANSKEKDSCIWTINYEWTFEELEQIELTLVQDEIGVGSNWTNGSVNMSEKKEGFKIGFKDFKKGLYNIGSPIQINKFKSVINDKTNFKNLQEILPTKGVMPVIINNIKERFAFEIAFNDVHLMHCDHANAIKNTLKELRKETNVKSFDGLFVYKYFQEVNKIMIAIEKRNEQAKQEENSPAVPFYNWLES